MKMMLATPLGQGGISAVWLSASEEKLAELEAMVRCPSGRARRSRGRGSLIYGCLVAAAGEVVDEIILAAPAQGLRIITGHGGISCTLALLAFLRERGFREVEVESWPLSAGPSWSENLIESEADRLLPACHTETQAALLLTARAGLAERVRRVGASDEALAGIDELLAGYAFARGALTPRRVCLAGAPNVGKSSLLNRLTGDERALVSEEPGTTRDAVEEWIDLGGYHALLTDTAGLGAAGGAVEQEAQARTREALARADVVVLMLDGSRALNQADGQAAEIVKRQVPGSEFEVPGSEFEVQSSEFRVPGSKSRNCAGETRLAAAEARAKTLARNRVDEAPPPRVLVVINKTDLPRALAAADIQNLLPGVPCCELSCVEGDPKVHFTAAAVPLLGGVWDGQPLPFTERQAGRLRWLREKLRSGQDPEAELRELIGGG